MASGYYETLPAYMADIFTLTQRAMAAPAGGGGADAEAEEEVELQALEFWSSIAEEELDRSGVRASLCVYVSVSVHARCWDLLHGSVWQQCSRVPACGFRCT